METNAWICRPLGECGRWISGGTPSKSNSEFWDGETPWVSAKDMKRFRIWDSQDHLTQHGVAEWGSLVPAGSVLLLVRGMTLLDDVPVAMAMRPLAINQDMKAIIPAQDVDGRFLAYWLLAQKPRLLAAVDQASHGTGRLSTDVLHKMSVALPNAAEQTRIADVLSAVDDKIDLNGRMNETLEAMARALFQSWFVDFEPIRAKAAGASSFPLLPNGLFKALPTRVDGSPIGPIPHGWRASALGDCIRVESGGTPSTSRPEYWDGEIPWFSVKDAPPESDVWVIGTEKRITSLGLENSSTKVLPVGTTIISARGTVGKLALVGTPMAMNQSCYGIRGANGYGDMFAYFLIKHAVDDLRQRTHGSVFDTITRETIRSAQVSLPPAELAHMFEQVVTPLLQMIRNLLFENVVLSGMRDTLLPKLISGEVRVRI